MSAAGWPSATATEGKPAPRESESTRVHRIAELMRRYKAKQDAAGVWRFWDAEKAEFSVAVYHDEATAAAGARITAAYAILEYVEGVPGR